MHLCCTTETFMYAQSVGVTRLSWLVKDRCSEIMSTIAMLTMQERPFLIYNSLDGLSELNQVSLQEPRND